MSERFNGKDIYLRPLTLDDCTDRYVGWLQDPEVNRYLETRWSEQSLDSVRSFVISANANPEVCLLGIFAKQGDVHVGNIKLGPMNPYHRYADISIFIGEKSYWGKGFATQAFLVATELGFSRFNLHRIQAGVYESNRGSIRALQKAGFKPDGRSEKFLKGQNGWEDHLWYFQLNPAEEGKHG